MSLRRLTVSAALLLLVPLPACGHLKRPVQTVVISPPYMASAYQCQGHPVVPWVGASDTDLAVFMAQLWGAWADCYDQLGAVGEDAARWDQTNRPAQK